ncbi:hypothetical protein AVEN_97625-1 [Araneus ventricosus]|uniref:Uncharacterized protein n=1 Tax=Araneus ventricosus TaxID=182803 RepID=A0A4Y2GHD1_ARAVE|nr:hypothetical protein AVEN_97625-1 [Araneus ventricosus]
MFVAASGVIVYDHARGTFYGEVFLQVCRRSRHRAIVEISSNSSRQLSSSRLLRLFTERTVSEELPMVPSSLVTRLVLVVPSGLPWYPDHGPYPRIIPSTISQPYPSTFDDCGKGRRGGEGAFEG